VLSELERKVATIDWSEAMAFIAGPCRFAKVSDQRFRIRVRGKKIRTSRDIWVVSTNGLSARDRAEMTKRYLEKFGERTVSFPLRERASHLMTRIDGRLFNFGRFVVNWIPRFRRKRYLVSSGRVLETILSLSQEEYEKLQRYLANILENRSKTIGRFGMEGCQFTNNRIGDNRPSEGQRKRHNCSSWIATAPISQGEKSLLEAMGGCREDEVATNPGWWTSWILATVTGERMGPIVLWTPVPLEVELEKLEAGHNFPWDFNKH
jgi:hypothetical protein